MKTSDANEQPDVLQLDNLATHFRTPHGIAKVVDGVSFSLTAGRTLAIVGESGSGKTMLARSIMGLIPTPPGIHAGGKILFNGVDLRQLSEKQWAKLRGKDMGMIFQDPMTSLNPVLTIGEQIGEVLRKHLGFSKKEARLRAAELLQDVGVPSADRRLDEYPHQLSGGLRQRVMIAMTVSCNPQLLIADEPTTALDVSIQAQILRLLKRYQREHTMAMIFVSHDLGAVAGIADDIAVMYGGRIVEMGPAAQIIQQPKMRYTRALLQSIPRLESPSHTRLKVIEGRPPNLAELPTGCAFVPRCDYAQEQCFQQRPELTASELNAPELDSPELNSRHRFACWFPETSVEVTA